MKEIRQSIKKIMLSIINKVNPPFKIKTISITILFFTMVAFMLTGCVHREGLAVFSGDTHINYEMTGFTAPIKANQRLLVSVKDNRKQFVGKEVVGKKARITDSALGRNMSSEFESVLMRELKSTGLFREVLLTDEKPLSEDYILDTELHVFFSEVKGFLIDISGAAIQFEASFSQNGTMLMKKSFTATGSEKERTARSGLFSTVADALDDVAAIALQKTMRDLLQSMADTIQKKANEGRLH